MIFEIYTPENPMSTVGSKSLAYFCNLFTLCIYCKQKWTNNLSYRSENMIFEIYTPKNPMSTVGS